MASINAHHQLFFLFKRIFEIRIDHIFWCLRSKVLFMRLSPKLEFHSNLLQILGSKHKKILSSSLAIVSDPASFQYTQQMLQAKHDLWIQTLASRPFFPKKTRYCKRKTRLVKIQKTFSLPLSKKNYRKINYDSPSTSENLFMYKLSPRIQWVINFKNLSPPRLPQSRI